MCERLADLETTMRRYAASFDAALLTAEQAGIAASAAGPIERMAAT